MKAIISWFLIFFVRIYQICISIPLHFIAGPFGGCRFEPTCSQYFIDAVLVHGPFKGGWMGTYRVFRCNPWGGHGCDPVPGWEEYVEKNPKAAYVGRRKPGQDSCCRTIEDDDSESTVNEKTT